MLISCSPPPFDLAVSQSAVTASRLTLAGQVGPIQNLPSSQINWAFAFFPEKDPSTGITLQAGFVSWVSQSTSQQIAFVVWDGSQGAYRVVASPQNLGMNNLNPPFRCRAISNTSS